MVFASFDLEEPGLIGSEYHVKNAGSLDDIKYVIDLECLGGGKDITLCMKVEGGVGSDEALIEKLYSVALSLGYEFIGEDYNFFKADHVPFAQRGVRTAEICSMNHDIYLRLGRVKLKKERGARPPYLYANIDGKKVRLSDEESKQLSIVHSERDLPENLNYENLVKVGEVLVKFLELEC